MTAMILGAARWRLTPHTINALCESFVATLERELLDRRRFVTHVEARLAVFDFIEGWSNPHRRHWALAYL